MGISISDVITAKRAVDVFLELNGVKLDDSVTGIYMSSPETGYGIYVNPTVRNITIHSPKSRRWVMSSKVAHPLVAHSDSHIFAPSSSKSDKTLKRTGDLWIGGFKDFAYAYAYAELLRKAILLLTKGELAISMGEKTGINFPVDESFRLFQ